MPLLLLGDLRKHPVILAAAKDGLALGVIDGVRVRHRGYVAASYDLKEAEAEDARALAKYEMTSQRDMQITVSYLAID